MTGLSVWLCSENAEKAAKLADGILKGMGKNFRSRELLYETEVLEKLCSGEKKDADLEKLTDSRMCWIGHVLARNGCAVVSVSRRCPPDAACGSAGKSPDSLMKVYVSSSGRKGSFSLLSEYESGRGHKKTVEGILKLLDEKAYLKKG